MLLAKGCFYEVKPMTVYKEVFEHVQKCPEKRPKNLLTQALNWTALVSKKFYLHK